MKFVLLVTLAVSGLSLEAFASIPNERREPALPVLGRPLRSAPNIRLSATPPIPAIPQENVEPQSHSLPETSTLHFRYPSQAPHIPSHHRRTGITGRIGRADRTAPPPPPGSHQSNPSGLGEWGTQDFSDARSIMTLPEYSPEYLPENLEEEIIPESPETTTENLNVTQTTQVPPPSYEQSCLPDNHHLISFLMENLPGESNPRQEALVSLLMDLTQIGSSYEPIQPVLARLLEEISSSIPSSSNPSSNLNHPQNTLTEVSLITILLDTIRDYSTAFNPVGQEQIQVQQNITRLEEYLFFSTLHRQFESTIQFYIRQSDEKAEQNRNDNQNGKGKAVRRIFKTRVPFFDNLLNSMYKWDLNASHQDQAGNVAEAFRGYTDQISLISQTLTLHLTEALRPIFPELAGGNSSFISLAHELESLAHREVGSGSLMDPIVRIERQAGSKIEHAREIGKVLASRMIAKMKARDSKKSSVNPTLAMKYLLKNGESLTAGQLLFRAQ